MFPRTYKVRTVVQELIPSQRIFWYTRIIKEKVTFETERAALGATLFFHSCSSSKLLHLRNCLLVTTYKEFESR
jgi:hypothetical protein